MIQGITRRILAELPVDGLKFIYQRLRSLDVGQQGALSSKVASGDETARAGRLQAEVIELLRQFGLVNEATDQGIRPRQVTEQVIVELLQQMAAIAGSIDRPSELSIEEGQRYQVWAKNPFAADYFCYVAFRHRLERTQASLLKSIDFLPATGARIELGRPLQPSEITLLVPLDEAAARFLRGFALRDYAAMLVDLEGRRHLIVDPSVVKHEADLYELELHELVHWWQQDQNAFQPGVPAAEELLQQDAALTRYNLLKHLAPAIDAILFDGKTPAMLQQIRDVTDPSRGEVRHDRSDIVIIEKPNPARDAALQEAYEKRDQLRQALALQVKIEIAAHALIAQAILDGRLETAMRADAVMMPPTWSAELLLEQEAAVESYVRRGLAIGITPDELRTFAKRLVPDRFSGVVEKQLERALE